MRCALGNSRFAPKTRREEESKKRERERRAGRVNRADGSTRSSVILHTYWRRHCDGAWADSVEAVFEKAAEYASGVCEK